MLLELRRHSTVLGPRRLYSSWASAAWSRGAVTPALGLGRRRSVVEDVEQVGNGLVPIDDGRLAPEAAFVRFHAVGHSHSPLGRPGEVSGHVLRRLPHTGCPLPGGVGIPAAGQSNVLIVLAAGGEPWGKARRTRPVHVAGKKPRPRLQRLLVRRYSKAARRGHLSLWVAGAAI